MLIPHIISYKILSVALAAGLALSLTACEGGSSLTPDVPDTPSGGQKTVPVTVLDYTPAPGQFVNEMPLYAEGDTYQAILAKAQQALDRGYCVSLGAFGGSITLKLNTPITHDPASADGDFRVLGNAFMNLRDGRITGGSSEPGVIQVMDDANANGLPDDEWCTILPDSPATPLTVTYSRHRDGDSDTDFIPWTASDGTSGFLNRVYSNHKHMFFPAWLPADCQSITVSGLSIPDNAQLNAATATWDFFPVGRTADSYPNTDPRSAVSIADAVRADGSPAGLTRISFVRVYTGVLACHGAVGDESTEICGIQAMH